LSSANGTKTALLGPLDWGHAQDLVVDAHLVPHPEHPDRAGGRKP